MPLIRILALLLCFSWILPLQAQDDRTPYEIALQRIEEARASGTTELSLAFLELEVLPSELWMLTTLHELDLSMNRLNLLPAEIGQLENLVRLNLSANFLVNIPPEIGQLQNLRLLYLGSNQLSTFPMGIVQLENLTNLHLVGNSLTSLPAEIGQLQNLQGLTINQNLLTSLPAEIGQLQNLCYLELRDNQLTNLPVELADITRFAQPGCGIPLSGNPLISPPQAVIDEGTPAVLAYLSNQAWWHLQRIIISVASGVGVLAILFLGLRWRYGRKKKHE